MTNTGNLQGWRLQHGDVVLAVLLIDEHDPDGISATLRVDTPYRREEFYRYTSLVISDVVAWARETVSRLFDDETCRVMTEALNRIEHELLDRAKPVEERDHDIDLRWREMPTVTKRSE